MNATSALKLRRAYQAQNPCTCMGALKNGGTATKLSAVVMGLGNMVHGQVPKGLLFLAVEIAYLVFMFTNGFHNLAMLVCSFIPFTSPIAMFTRIAMSSVPPYQIALSIGLLAITVVGIGVLSAKIYRVGVLLYGTPPKIGAILKAVWQA